MAVLAGGRSSEHEISLASARSVVEALDPARYETQVIEIGRDGAWALPPGDGPRSRSTESGASLPIPTAATPAALGAVDVVLPDPARAVRRGRDGAGLARARRRARTSAPA